MTSSPASLPGFSFGRTQFEAEQIKRAAKKAAE
jgi:hypothetical protein